MPLQPHEERMIADASDLGENIRKLNAFLGGENFLNMPREDADLLTIQREHMVAYFSTLQKRINRINS